MSCSVNTNKKANIIGAIADKSTMAYRPLEYAEVTIKVNLF